MEHLLAGRRIGRHSLIVSGHTPPTEPPVDFDQAAIHLWKRIRSTQTGMASSSQAIHFSFSSGNISLLSLDSAKRLKRQTLRSFTAPEPEHYGKLDSNKRLFISPRTRTLSILDVYAYVFHLGTHSANAIESLLVVSHAWEEGPVLVNTVDPFPHLPWHSPADKDARRKDLRPPQLSETDRIALRRAFSSDGYCINAGCGGYKALQPLLLRAEEGPAWNAEDIRELHASALLSWNQAFANAANVPCFGAFPGISTGLELNGEQPTLSVPQQAIADRPDFSAALRELERTLGCRRDPWGLGLVQFNPEIGSN